MKNRTPTSKILQSRIVFKFKKQASKLPGNDSTVDPTTATTTSTSLTGF